MNKSIKIFVVVIISLAHFTCFSQEIIGQAKETITILTADSMTGREAGTIGEQKAKKYLAAQFKQLGLTTLNGSYFHEFDLPLASKDRTTSMNLVGTIDNKQSSTIIIGAHYDHIGLGGSKSRSFTSSKIHYGADDNASGVAMMLLLAEYLKDKKYENFNYVFIAFSGHEDGLYGSKAFVAENIYELSRVKLMVNLDMVGRLDVTDPKLKVIRSNGDDYLDSMLNSGRKDGFKLVITENHVDHTDASIFIKNGVPAISFTTGIHDDYHKVSDVAEKINYEGMTVIINYITHVIGELDDKSLSKI